jgi:hypothetical protein
MVTETITATECTNSNSVTVIVNPLPAANPGLSRSICSGENATLGDLSRNGIQSTYSWTSDPVGFTSTERNPIVSPTVTTTYTLVETYTATGCSASNSVTITVNPLPAAAAGADRDICLNANTTIGAAAVSGSSYIWSSNPSGFTSTLANPTVSPTVTTTYTVTETIAVTGCNKLNSVKVTVKPLPTATISGTASVCLSFGAQLSFAFTGTAPWTFIYDDGSNYSAPVTTSDNPYTFIVYPLTTTTYTVYNVFDATGCVNSGTGSAVITVKNRPTAVLSGDAVYCNGSSTTTALSLAVTGSGTISGTLSDATPFSGTAPTITVNVTPAATTTYTIASLVDGNCNAIPADMSGSATITVNSLPDAPTAGNVTVCYDGSTYTGSASVGTGQTVVWYTTATGSIITTAPSGSAVGVYTAYSAAKITSTGCESATRTLVTVTIKALPAAVAGNDRIVCGNTSTVIGAAAVSGSTYSWTSVPPGFTSTLANPTVTPTVTTTYTVTETVTATGCTNTHSVMVTTKPIPAAIVGADRNLCLGSYTTLGAAAVPGNTYSWTSLPVFMTSTQANPTVAPLVTAVYTLVETITATGCTNTHSVTVTVYPVAQVSVTIAASANPVCLGSMVTMTATPVNGGTNPTYQWKLNNLVIPGATNSTYGFYPYTPTTAVTCVLTTPPVPCKTGSPATSNVVDIIVPEVCPVITVIGTVGSGEIICYDATQTITVAGGGNSFIVSPTAEVTMIAGQNIIYLPGTLVEPGGYMIGKIAPNGPYCGQQPTSLVTVLTGEDELPVITQSASFSLWPNPTTGKFTLEQTGDTGSKTVKVAIYGMHGEKVITRDLSGEKKYELSIAELPVGLYFVKVVSGEYTRTIKLIKTN